MRERSTQILAMFVSIVGLFLLYIVSEDLASAAPISSLSLEHEGSITKICGDIVSKGTFNNHIFLEVNDGSGTITVVVFNSTALRLNKTGTDLFSHTGKICVTGLIEEYPPGSGKAEIIFKTGEL